MPTLIIPDIHERLYVVTDKLRGHIQKADKVCFLGDWFDTFAKYDDARIGQVCSFIVSNIQTKPNWTWILGNHDLHYMCPTQLYTCSGYNRTTHMITKGMISPKIWRLFKIYTKVGPYTVSHAGFSEASLLYAKPYIEREAIEVALRGKYDSIFGAGHARGGRLPLGGPLWLDWAWEFEHIDDFPQIVGHTPANKVRSKGNDGQLKSWCADTHSKHVLWVDEETGVVEVEEV